MTVSIRADNPVVSVVTPAFMAEEFIAETMLSVWCQNHRPIEHIIVVDASPDRTAAVARNTVTSRPDDGYSSRIIELAENVGTAGALNAGIRVASGNYVSWLSADDLFVDVNKTTRQLAFAQANPGLAGVFDLSSLMGPDVAHSRQVESHWPSLLRMSPGLRRFDPSQVLYGLLFANPINGTSVVLRRDALPTGDWFDSALGTFDQDGDLWLRMQALGLPLGGCPGTGTLYREHPGQNSRAVDRMEEGSSISRIRILLALADAGLLVPSLHDALGTLTLGVTRGMHRSRPAVFRALVDLARPSSDGVLGSVLGIISLDLSRFPKHDQALWLARREQAQERRSSVVFGSFEKALRGRREVI